MYEYGEEEVIRNDNEDEVKKRPSRVNTRDIRPRLAQVENRLGKKGNVWSPYVIKHINAN